MGEKYIDESWDFRKEDTKYYTHGLHTYPAIMIPQIAGRLIDQYGIKAKLLFDPYCGSGTSLVEASIRGIDSIGTDLNPLARLLSKVKSTVIDIKILENYIKDFFDISFQKGFGKSIGKDYSLPDFKNIDFWFDKRVQQELAFIKNFIEEIQELDIRNFFKIPFSETVRESSWTRNSEFKLYRMTEQKMSEFNPDVLAIMDGKLIKALCGLKNFIKNKKNGAKVGVYDFNTVSEIPKEILSKGKVDIVVTSPPYGDSRTTVAYGQFSRLSNEWIGFKDAQQVDKSLMGGSKQERNGQFESIVLNECLKKVEEIDNKRVMDVVGFYSDYKKSINNIAPLLKKNGFACFVVGNRKVKGIQLPTDEITIDFFKSNGFMHVETVIRNIPNKRMPSKNSPTNESGKVDSTMTNEYIVIMKKTV